MRSALRRCPDLSLVPRDGIVVTADPTRISAAQMDIWRKSAKRKTPSPHFVRFCVLMCVNVKSAALLFYEVKWYNWRR
jgi:hypothetical protein